MTDNSQEFTQRTVRAVIVCLLVVFAYTNLVLAPKKKAQSPVAPPPQQAVQIPQQADKATTAVTAPQAGPVQVVGAPQAQAQHPTAADIQAAGITYVQSGLIKVGFSHLGARVQSYALLNYKARQGDEAPLDIVGDLSNSTLPLGVYVGNENDENVRYQLVSVNGAPATASPANLQIAPGGAVTVEFKGTLPSGHSITKSITLSDNSYLFAVDVNLGSTASGQSIWVEWLHRYHQDSSRSSGLSHVTVLDGANKIHHLSADQLKSQTRETARWIALGDLYFMASLIPPAGENNAALALSGETYIGRVAAPENGGKFTIYAGPKIYRTTV